MGRSIFLTTWDEYYANKRNRARSFAILTVVSAGSLFLGIATLYRWSHWLPLWTNLILGIATWVLPTGWVVYYRTYLRLQEMYELADRDEQFNRLLTLAYTTLMQTMNVLSVLAALLFLGIAAAGAALSRR